MTTAIAAIFAFFLVVLVHEFGHFAVAKLVGIKVHEFAIGMGPRLTNFKKGETEYSLRLIPIGGYVKMEGEDEKSDDVRSFSNKPPLARMAVLAAGAFMNFLLALIIFFFVSYSLGVPTTTIEKVIPEKPAYKSGLRSGDQIININGKETESWESVVNEINENKSGNIKVTVLRNGTKKEFNVKPQYIEKDNRYEIGIHSKTKKSVTMAIKGGFRSLGLILGAMINFFKSLFVGNFSSAEVGGPVRVVHMIGKAAQYGLLNLFSFIGLISVNLGFFNLLPIPALDGSRLLFALTELVRGKPINPEKEGLIHFIGFVFLLLLMVVVTYKDLTQLNVF
ncbi:MAG: RIP metalloprotease RseP [Firmicutes bacterium]|nr:RIP metalloprotease RseP [Bacillota bacterium]